MAIKRSDRLPDPPEDLWNRKLLLQRIRAPFFRVHPTSLDCLYFSRDKSGRFDPEAEYGVLYAAVQPEAAFAEVFLRQLSLMLVFEADLRTCSISQIGSPPLACVDLTWPGLRKLSCDNRIATEKPYTTVGRWSRALFTHPERPDGVMYRSRHNPQFKCLAIFDRSEAELKVNWTESLLLGNRLEWTIKQIKRYNLAVEPVL